MTTEFRYNQILLVEDTEIDGYIASYLLEKYYIARQIIIKKNGADAFSMLNDSIQSNGKLPEVIILDMRLPDMSANELLEKISHLQEEKISAIKIIAVSAIAYKYEIELIKNNKLVQQFIPKPLSIHSINLI
jgi:CheY-like chemotaxis protein